MELGTRASGKSTILKQIKASYRGGGYSADERLLHKQMILRTISWYFRSIFAYMDPLEVKLRRNDFYVRLPMQDEQLLLNASSPTKSTSNNYLQASMIPTRFQQPS